MKHQISVKEIIQRLKTSLNINSDDKLAELIGVSRPTVTNWKARNSIDYTLIFELFPELDLNWLIKGVGDAQQNVVSSTSKTNFDNLDEVIRLGRENKKLKESLSTRMINSGIRKLEAEIEVLKIRLEERDRLIDKFITGKEISSKPINRKSINLSSQSPNEHTKSVPCGD